MIISWPLIFPYFRRQYTIDINHFPSQQQAASHGLSFPSRIPYVPTCYTKNLEIVSQPLHFSQLKGQAFLSQIAGSSSPRARVGGMGAANLVASDFVRAIKATN